MTFVELAERGNKCQLTQFVQEAIPPSVELFDFSPENLSLDQQLSLFIGRLRDSFSPRGEATGKQKQKREIPSLFLSFPQEKVVMRYFKMLKIPKREWQTAIRFEARKYLPFNMEKVNSDFILLPPQKRSAEMEVVFFAIDQSYSERFSLFFKELGWVSTAMETPSLSVLRVLKWNGQLQKSSPGGVLLSVEPERLGISLFIEGTPYFSREVRWTASMTEPCSSEMIESIAGEVRLASEFHRKNFPDRELSAVYPFGTFSNEEVAKELSAACEMKAFAVDPYLKISGEKPERVSSQIVIGIGAALRGLSQQPVGDQIHLERVVTKEKKKIPTPLLLSGGGVLALMILGWVQVLCSSQIKAAQNIYDEVVVKRPVVTRLPNPLVNVEELSKIVQRYQQKLSLLHDILEERVDLTSKMSLLAETLPETMWIQKVEWSDQSQEREISMSGGVYSPQRDEVGVANEFAERLKNSEFFDGLKEAQLTKVEKSQLGFQKITRFEWQGSSKEKRK